MIINKITRKIQDVFRPILSDTTIERYIDKGLLVENLPDKRNIQPNSVDLTITNDYKIPLPNNTEGTIMITGGLQYMQDPVCIIDPVLPIKYQPGTFNDCITILPGQFVLLASTEILHIPNGIVAFVQGRSSVARIGVQTEQAGLIDTGFRGTITFEVYNETPYPIRLYKGMRVAQVYFFKSQFAKLLYGSTNRSSKYSGQIEATGSKINNDPELLKYRKDQ